MTNNGFSDEPTAYDPASMAGASLLSMKVVWYKRPWFLLTLAIFVVVAVSVITDLPHPLSKTEDAAAQNATMKQINSDVAPCDFAIKETFSFYDESIAGLISKANLRQIPHLLVADQSVCSFTSGSIYDLTNNIQVLDTKAGKHLDSMLIVVVKWATDDALAAIEDIQYLFVHPGDTKKIHDLAIQQMHLTRDRKIALADEALATSQLGITLTPLKLPILTHLSGT